MGRDALAPATKAPPAAAAGAPAPGVIGAGTIEALAALDAGDGGRPARVNTGVPGCHGKVVTLACHGGAGEVVVDATRPLVDKRVVIGVAGIGVVHRGVDSGVGVIGLAVGVVAAHALARELLGGSGLVGLELGQLGGILLLGLCLGFAAKLLGLCQCVLGGFLLGLELGLGLLELGLVLLEFGLHLVELFDLVDARARDLVGVLAGGDELAQALRVDQEAHDGVGALLVLIQIAHGGARLGLLIGKFGFDLLDACLVSVDLLLQILELGAGFVVGTRGGFDFLLGSGKLILRCLRGGIGCDGREHRRGRQCNGERGARDDTNRLRRDERCGAMVRMLHPVPLQSIVGYSSKGILLLLSTST